MCANPKNKGRQQGPLIPVPEGPIEGLAPAHRPVQRRRGEINLGGEEKAQQRRGKQNDRGASEPGEPAALTGRRVEMGRVVHQRNFGVKQRFGQTPIRRCVIRVCFRQAIQDLREISFHSTIPAPRSNLAIRMFWSNVQLT